MGWGAPEQDITPLVMGLAQQGLNERFGVCVSESSEDSTGQIILLLFRLLEFMMIKLEEQQLKASPELRG